jgi:hypothetical protein
MSFIMCDYGLINLFLNLFLYDYIFINLFLLLAKHNVGAGMGDGLSDLSLVVDQPNPQQLWNDISGMT